MPKEPTLKWIGSRCATCLSYCFTVLRGNGVTGVEYPTVESVPGADGVVAVAGKNATKFSTQDVEDKMGEDAVKELRIDPGLSSCKSEARGVALRRSINPEIVPFRPLEQATAASAISFALVVVAEVTDAIVLAVDPDPSLCTSIPPSPRYSAILMLTYGTPDAKVAVTVFVLDDPAMDEQ